MTFNYRALKVQQRIGAKPFYLLSAPATDIVKWADVPRKKEEYRVGYQRSLEADRTANLQDFLNQDASNIMPGSVLIALQESQIEIKPVDNDESLCDIVIKVDNEKNLKDLLYNNLYNRLDENEKQYVDRANISDLSLPKEEIEGAEQILSDDEDINDKPTSYLAFLVAELKFYDKLNPKRQKDIMDYIASVSKPGLILDGQHRVFGAKNAKDNISLPIVILPGMEYSEQVFHFYVINNKAKPIKPTELRSVISTSLSNNEISMLYNRFKLAGVLTEEAQWTHNINVDKSSPFQNLINFGLERERGIIPENVMYQVVKKFLKPNSKYNANFNLVPVWRDDAPLYEYRLDLFFTFWKTIQNLYPQAWQNAINLKNKQLMMKVTMLVLQEFVFDKMDSLIPFLKDRGMSLPHENQKEFSEQIRFFLQNLPEEFFLKEWTEKGLDTPKGKELLKDQIEKAVLNKGKNLGNMTLFKTKK